MFAITTMVWFWEGAGWPRVYVYDVPEYWDMKTKLRDLARVPAENPEIFGPKCSAGLYDEYATHMYSAPMILLWRILRSPRWTTNPAEADLFFVPMWPKQKSQKLWEDRCARDANLFLAEKLRHLTPKTAHRHFFVVGKGHVKVGGKCDAWWKKPENLLLRKAMRFAYSSDYGTSDRIGQERYGPYTLDTPLEAARLAADLMDNESPYPHLVSIPYPSSVHVDAATLRTQRRVDWVRTSSTSYLASFVGGSHSRSTFAMARRVLRKDCAARPDACFYFNYDRSHGVFTCGLHRFMSNATFCFQPGGDSPYRKSLYDAFLTGCIPVVFSQYNARVAPFHFWAGHAANAMVVLNATAYLAGDLDVLAHLSAIDPSIVRKMQATIALHAHRLHYAIDDYPDDAVDLLLKGAAHLAATRDRLSSQ
ncbi:hypothetical protein CTAYLR_009805 [Chrysophaeum taylorii]|uniref:Exostosin GT47 domain-containing protein n=1 Tax=Chrysophaeum taylorii TaxID=2483200 RepID=A0AAD7XR70_9STRA|nr:hypothetical protein CTAYLR_006534 [Chrysophaeum taylorii]KAJ8612587.1 hypothetical protein CTAYLR_009805 [Chrysophaeum taylorii]